jgi:hypothetical protein
MFNSDFQWHLSHKLVLFSLGLFNWRKYNNGILSYCFNNYILQLHQLQPHFTPIDKLCHWYADSIQAAVHFQHLGFIHIRCRSCCNMLFYVTVNIPNINTSECQSLHSWSLIWVVSCVFLSNVRNHIVQKNIRRNSSDTRLISLGQSSRLQLGGWYLWLLVYAGMFPSRTSVHSLWFCTYGHR